MTTFILGQRVREARVLERRNVPGLPDRRRPPMRCRAGRVTSLRSGEVHVQWDIAMDVSATLPLVSGEWLSVDSVAPEIVHVLYRGLPVCNFTRDSTNDWPDGHVWVWLGAGTAEANCDACIKGVRVLLP